MASGRSPTSCSSGIPLRPASGTNRGDHNTRGAPVLVCTIGRQRSSVTLGCVRSICVSVLALGLAGSPLALAQQTTGATFGDVGKLTGGTPSDVVLDESRQRLYLINNSTSQVYIFDYSTSQVIGNIPVGKSPVAGAISMDNHWLYVT